MFLKHISFIQIILLIFKCNTVENKVNKNRIAIIGGGIGGTSAAYELTNLALEHGLDFEMDLYEPDKIGGRLATSLVNGFEFETGGSIIHSANKYMNLYVEKFNLSKNFLVDKPNRDGLFGFYNGKEFVFIDSHYNLITMFKLWWRYGMDLLKINKILDYLISNFTRIYELQSNKETLSDVHHFLSSLSSDFPALLNITIKDYLLSQNVHDLFLKEILFLTTNVNYNQNIDIHGFVGAVALAGGSSENLWSVQGGNKLVPELLLAHSDARLLKKAVQSVVLLPNSKYALNVDNSTYVYDYVIIACPIFEESKYKITFEGFPVHISPPVKYMRTIATLVHGVLNHTYFNYELSVNAPNNIFSINEDLFFNSINVLEPVTPDEKYDGKVFKIFSKKVLTDTQLDSLFLTRESVSMTEWFAYPIYDTQDRNLSFTFHDNLFYVSAIEWAASSMEMSALSGVNAALHVFKTIQGTSK